MTEWRRTERMGQVEPLPDVVDADALVSMAGNTFSAHAVLPIMSCACAAWGEDKGEAEAILDDSDSGSSEVLCIA